MLLPFQEWQQVFPKEDRQGEWWGGEDSGGQWRLMHQQKLQ